MRVAALILILCAGRAGSFSSHPLARAPRSSNPLLQRGSGARNARTDPRESDLEQALDVPAPAELTALPPLYEGKPRQNGHSPEELNGFSLSAMLEQDRRNGRIERVSGQSQSKGQGNRAEPEELDGLGMIFSKLGEAASAVTGAAGSFLAGLGGKDQADVQNHDRPRELPAAPSPRSASRETPRLLGSPDPSRGSVKQGSRSRSHEERAPRPLRRVASAAGSLVGRIFDRRKARPVRRDPRRVEFTLDESQLIGFDTRRGFRRRLGDFYRRRISNFFRKRRTPWARVQSIGSAVGDRAKTLVNEQRRNTSATSRRWWRLWRAAKRNETLPRATYGSDASARASSSSALSPRGSGAGVTRSRRPQRREAEPPTLNPFQAALRLVTALTNKFVKEDPEIPAAVISEGPGRRRRAQEQRELLPASLPEPAQPARQDAVQDPAAKKGRFRFFRRVLGRSLPDPVADQNFDVAPPAMREYFAGAPAQFGMVESPTRGLQSASSSIPSSSARDADADDDKGWASLGFLNPYSPTQAPAKPKEPRSAAARDAASVGTHPRDARSAFPPASDDLELKLKKIRPDQVVMPGPEDSLASIPRRAASPEAQEFGEVPPTLGLNALDGLLQGIAKRAGNIRTRLGTIVSNQVDETRREEVAKLSAITETAQAAMLRRIDRERISVAIETAKELMTKDELDEFIVQGGLKTLFHGLEGGPFAVRTEALMALAHCSGIDAGPICSHLIQRDSAIVDLVAMLETSVDPVVQGVLWTANEVEYVEDAQVAVAHLLLDIVLESERLTNRLRSNPRVHKALHNMVQRGSRRDYDPDLYAPLSSKFWREKDTASATAGKKGETPGGKAGKSKGKDRRKEERAGAVAAKRMHENMPPSPGNARKKARERRKRRAEQAKEDRFVKQLEKVTTDSYILANDDPDLMEVPSEGVKTEVQASAPGKPSATKASKKREVNSSRKPTAAAKSKKEEAKEEAAVRVPSLYDEDGIDKLHVSPRPGAGVLDHKPDPNADWSRSVNDALGIITPSNSSAEQSNSATSLWDAGGLGQWASHSGDNWPEAPENVTQPRAAASKSSAASKSTVLDGKEVASRGKGTQRQQLETSAQPPRKEASTERQPTLPRENSSMPKAEDLLDGETDRTRELPRPRSLPRDARSLARILQAAMGHESWKPREGFPQQKGVRVLALDGGGARGVVAIMQLKELVQRTGKELHELFDVICGTSTGGIIAVLLGVRRMSIDDIERLYDILLGKIFQRLPGAGAKLVWSTAYYDERVWETILTDILGTERLIYSNAAPGAPNVFCVSTILSKNPARIMLWRTYNYPVNERESRYDGSFRFTVAEALRATTAAPTFFTPMARGNELYSDGAMMANNPAAVAVHEARRLYPDTPLELLVSVGTGRTEVPANLTRWGWDSTLNLLANSATNTETPHFALEDTLPSSVYYRFNPAMTPGPIDEIRPEVLALLKKEAKDSLKKPETSRRLDELVNTLMSSASDNLPFI